MMKKKSKFKVGQLVKLDGEPDGKIIEVDNDGDIRVATIASNVIVGLFKKKTLEPYYCYRKLPKIEIMNQTVNSICLED